VAGFDPYFFNPGVKPMAYPPSSDAVRTKLESLSTLPPQAPEWAPFMQDVIRMPMWMLPAVHAAIERKAWVTAADPLESIRGLVRRFAIDMKLNNSEKRIAIDPDDED
jgi:hypothetical protein